LPEGLAHEDSAEYLAVLKADAARPWLTQENLSLTADSVVLLGNQWLGKPRDAQEAIETLTKLCGHTHTAPKPKFEANFKYPAASVLG